MKRWIKKSFNRELLVCFAVVAMLPLFFSGLFLIKIMETKINDDYEKKILAQAEQIDSTIKLRIGEYLLTGVVFGNTAYKIGQNVKFEIAGDDILLFDRKSGRRIASGNLSV